MLAIRMRSRSINLLMLSCAAPLASWAITLDQLVESALQQHPDLEFARGSLEAGRIQESSLPWWDAPELRVAYGRDSSVTNSLKSETYPDHDYAAGLRVFPKNPWERKAEQRLLSSQNGLLELSLSEGEWAVATGVKERYWKCAYLRAELDLEKQLLEVLKEQEARQQALLDSGQITVGQSLPSRINRLELAMEVESSQSEFEVASAELAAICGVDSSEIELSAPKHLTASDYSLPYETWGMKALGERADVQRYGMQVEGAQAELETIKAREIPWIKHVQANYRVRNDFGDEDSASIGIAIDLPFFASDGGEKRIASSMLETHHRQAFQVRKIAEHEVKALIAEFKASERQWQIQGEQLQSMQQELTAAIDTMESQGNHANESYWDARVSQLKLQLKQLELSQSFQRLLLKAERVLGASPR